MTKKEKDDEGGRIYYQRRRENAEIPCKAEVRKR